MNIQRLQIPWTLRKMRQDPETPFLLQVMIDVNIRIAFGRPITEMEPFVRPLDMMEST
jgi:hypothetical protein